MPGLKPLRLNSLRDAPAFVACWLWSAAAGAQSAPDAAGLADSAARALDLQTSMPARATGPEPDVPWWLRLLGQLSLDTFRTMVWIAIICGAIVLFYFVSDMFRSGFFGRRAGWDEAPELAGGSAGGGRTDAAAQLAADDLARQGRFVEAMHVLLLQGLAEMRKRLDLSFADSLTSREIMRQAPVSTSAKTALGEIVGWVERAYFGDHPAGNDAYVACRRSFAALSEALSGEARR
jgi:hypothetical protein